MQGIDIVNRLKEIVGYYTDDFSDIINISSLSRSGSTITAITSAPHNLVTNNYTTIRGAKEPILLSSITIVGNIATVTSSVDHKLSDPSLYSEEQKPYITISGALPVEYNGIFELLTVPDDLTFTFKITTNLSVNITAGYLLLEDFEGYNGYKQVTVLSPTSFTYSTIRTNINTPAQGTIKLSNATRVDHAATPARILDFYSENSEGILKNWMFVVLGSAPAYKNDTIASDLSTAQKKNQSYWYEIQRNFSIFVVVPSKTSVLGGVQADLARSYEKALNRSIVNYQFPSVLSEVKYQPVTYVDNDEDDYIKAYYVHRFDYLVKSFIQTEDTISFNDGVPLELVDGTITDKQMTFKPNMRDS